MKNFKDLREYIDFLDSQGQLVRIRRKVDPVLEINAIVDKLARVEGPVVIFENVKGSDMPVLGNLYGSHQRVAWSFGADNFFPHACEKLKNGFTDMGKTLDTSQEAQLEQSFMYAPLKDRLKKYRGFIPYYPVEVKGAPCKEVVYAGDQIDIGKFPLTKLWPEDGDRFVTMPLIITRDPESGELNAGTYRMMYLDKNKTCMHWLPHKHGHNHWQTAEKLGIELPVVVVVGCDPGLAASGCFMLRPPLDEFLFTSLLKGRGIDVVKADLSDLPVPASAEIVMEGVIKPGIRAKEGPFGEFHGYYSPPKQTPVFEIQRITTRKNPLWHMATTGKPVTEIHYMSKAAERVTMAIQNALDSDIVDMSFATEGASLYLMTISIKKERPYQGQEMIKRIWKARGQSKFISNVIVVDEDIDVHNLSEVMWAFSMHTRANQDLLISDKVEQDLEHPAMSPRGEGARLGIDATRKWKEENYTRERPGLVVMDDDIMKRVLENWESDGLGKP
ncbi:MAG: UbiD family decarboxylase [Thermodesulfobacteriota bacterium]